MNMALKLIPCLNILLLFFRLRTCKSYLSHSPMLTPQLLTIPLIITEPLAFLPLSEYIASASLS